MISNRKNIRRINDQPIDLNFSLSFVPLILAVLTWLLTSGCSETTPFTGEHTVNLMPVVELTSGPVEGDSVQYNIHFYWLGDDPDGEIDHYEVALVDGDPIGFDPEDTTGADKWTTIHSTDTLIVATADEFSGTVTINNALYAIYDRVHTFFLRAIDDRGGVSTIVHRSFNSWTLAPQAFITSPRQTNGVQMLCPMVCFKWYGKDPVDSPWNYQNVDSVRFMWTTFYKDVVRDLNSDPGKFEHLWSRWHSIDAPGDSGRSTVLGDDEIVPTTRTFIFAVQAKDEAGAISSVFDERTNVRVFMVRDPTGPLLKVREPNMGSWSFMGYDLDPVSIDIPPGFEMNFSWTADASSYGARVSTYRYGWDITDFDDAAMWATIPIPNLYSASPKKYYSGVHTLYIEATDHIGVSTVCAIEVNVVPATMSRDLLWVDDMPSTNFIQSDYAFPSESEHDEFWTDICMIAPSFLPSRDIFDIAEASYEMPPTRLIFSYKNIIWTYSNARDVEAGSLWGWLDAPQYYYFRFIFNYLPYFMSLGGHVWTSGISFKTGGLYTWTSYYGYPLTASRENRMAVRDYCVSAVDKIAGKIRSDIPFDRSIEDDALSRAYLDSEDPLTAGYPGLPERLELWDAVTRPGSFFDPEERGFLYVEAYNPPYWMSYTGLLQKDCFHPIYLLETRSDDSVLNGAPIAFWTTKYADVVAPGEVNCAAASVHFGVPLWFFDRAQVDSIATVIFDEWQILQK